VSDRFSESTIEEATLDWLERQGWQVAHGPDIAPDTPGAERTDAHYSRPKQ